jgi:hypothetical protein
MTRQAKATSTSECYKPSPTLVNYVQKKLHAERKKREGRGAAGEVDKELRLLDRSKNYTLNNIVFPSMANVVYFLEEVSKNPELQELFDDDLKDLLEIRIPQHLADKGHNIVLRRLIEALVDWMEQPIIKSTGERDEEKMSRARNSNIRLAFMRIIQMVIYYKARSLSLHEISAEMSNRIIDQDFGRAWMWTNMFARKVEEDELEPHRPARF